MNVTFARVLAFSISLVSSFRNDRDDRRMEERWSEGEKEAEDVFRIFFERKRIFF